MPSWDSVILAVIVEAILGIVLILEAIRCAILGIVSFLIAVIVKAILGIVLILVAIRCSILEIVSF